MWSLSVPVIFCLRRIPLSFFPGNEWNSKRSVSSVIRNHWSLSPMQTHHCKGKNKINILALHVKWNLQMDLLLEELYLDST